MPQHRRRQGPTSAAERRHGSALAGALTRMTVSNHTFRARPVLIGEETMLVAQRSGS